ncbi:hypothetical protein [Flavobacterium sp.]|jgi:hypothetical protein|uniref:hypothetical protein n=1 Tax=Flavobacterium sp. TaxID=239 RepID=UPI0037BFE358
MTTYNIALTQAEDKALAFVALSQDDWIQNAVHERCRIAIDEIVQITVAKCLETNIQIPGSKDEMVELAYTQGWIKTAAQRQAEFEAQAAAEAAARQAQEAQGE